MLVGITEFVQCFDTVLQRPDISETDVYKRQVQDSGYELKSDLYPLNVCYNVGLAFQRTALTQDYHRTSKDFTFHARPTHPEGRREVYVMVVGETSRARNWQLYGYELSLIHICC